MTSHRIAPAPGVAAGVVLLAGVYLVLAPWLAHFGGAGVLALSNTVTGLVLVALAIARTATPRVRRLTWVVPVLGVWAGISLVALRPTWVTWPSAAAIVGNVVAAVVAVLAGVALTRV
ncbi:SPW repeat protein [Amycolatopsis sp. WQ 127309]|uniref:SPW repeat protein n=1 Tax=Amycolatopsis sp. WQ 127309 TaxID=2932773 RepID=UPI001FF61BC0|nr:SPW repeat protein [Amycolatopsis sp. WQ 127309]UOZ04821.1 SPW repeat protein [Amycolatopsis sp. WQ 127309]